MPSVPMAEAPEQPGRCPTLICRNLWKAGPPTPPQAPSLPRKKKYIVVGCPCASPSKVSILQCYFSQVGFRSRVTQSIGLLSYTYLRRTMKDDIVVPMIDFQILGGQALPLVYGSQDDWDQCLKIILDWSPFSTKEELLLQFEDIRLHGTKVLIYNLWMNDDGLLELDFDDNDQDILLRDHVCNDGFSRSHKEIVQSHISFTHRYSLRAYVSILYLRKFSKFEIILRGEPVRQLHIEDDLKFKKVVTYKPQVGINSEVVSVRTKLGFAKEAPVLGIFGINVYHKNRLIMA